MISTSIHLQVSRVSYKKGLEEFIKMLNSVQNLDIPLPCNLNKFECNSKNILYTKMRMHCRQPISHD